MALSSKPILNHDGKYEIPLERRFLQESASEDSEDEIVSDPKYLEEPSPGWTSDLVESYQQNPIMRKWHVIYVQRPWEPPKVSATQYARKIDETIELQNAAMEFHEIPHRIVKGNVYVKDSSLYFETKEWCGEALDLCMDWAKEFGRVEDSWDMWMCSMPPGYYPDCGGMAWMPGDVSFMGEHSWYAPYGGGAGPSGQGSNGILHEMGHNFNAEHQAEFCYPNIENGVSSDIGWITMQGGGDGCKWEKDPVKILVYTDPTKQYCEGERCVILGDEHHDNASRMRKRLHDMLVNIVPSCPAGDSRGFCVKKRKTYCATNVDLGELDVTECAKLIEEDPSKCPSKIFAYGAKIWGCRCCAEDAEMHDHDTWSLYEQKYGTLHPTPTPSNEPTPSPEEKFPTETPTQPPVSVSLINARSYCDKKHTTLRGETSLECAQWIKFQPDSCPSKVFAFSRNVEWGCTCCDSEARVDHDTWNQFKVLDDPMDDVCKFMQGDGIGASEMDTWENLTGQDCAKYCLQIGGYNGATIRANGEPGCWCENGMTGSDGKSEYMSCFVTEPETTPDPCADQTCPSILCYDGSVPPIADGECCGFAEDCPKAPIDNVCEFMQGDGIAGSEMDTGENLTGQYCAQYCLQLGGYDGATIRANGEPGCWCENGMTGSDGGSDYMTCFLTHIEWILLRSNVECSDNSNESDLGNKASVEECARACKNRDGCTNFIYGKGSKAGSCWDEGITQSACTTWEDDEYDFYALQETKHDAEEVQTIYTLTSYKFDVFTAFMKSLALIGLLAILQLFFNCNWREHYKILHTQQDEEEI